MLPTSGRPGGCALWRTAATTALVAGLFACARPEPDAMVPLDPPRGWAQTVPHERQQRDEWFRASPDTPLPAADLPAFTGLSYWDPDSRYYFLGPLNEYAQKAPFTIVTTTGQPRPCEKVGWVAFPLGGQIHRLQVYRLLDEPGSGTSALFLPFMDLTSGAETYPAGRYVDLEGPEGGPYALDFNKAYNPSCAYGAPERFACPATPAENRLKVRIEAGERGWKHGPERVAG